MIARAPLWPRTARSLPRADFKIATAESCTGGMVAALLTSIAGSSDVFDCGFVTYSNEAKTRMLGVSPEIIAEFGAVSRECALAMAQGPLLKSSADACSFDHRDCRTRRRIGCKAGGTGSLRLRRQRNGATLHRRRKIWRYRARWRAHSRSQPLSNL